jgi:hypothetical protein
MLVKYFSVKHLATITLALGMIAAPASFVAAAPNLDGEEIPADEQQATEEVKRLIVSLVGSEARKHGRAFRDAHRKHHGCVGASFTVKPDIPAELRHGIFRQPATYSAIVRYSNGSGRVESDHDGDGRGMAVKLLGVEGERNLGEADDERTSQDFVMVNHPVFFVRTAAKYVAFQQALQSDRVLLWVFNPIRFFHEGLIGLAILRQKMINPLDATYFSMVPSKLGPTQMKFRARPCEASRFENPSDTPNRLGENLIATLNKTEACFQFQVQPRLNAATMPIEDPTIDWKESDSPFQTVAEIRIPKQTPGQGEACEVISYNPWNGLKEHRPLGGISRVRKDVYQAISRLRHELNRQPREEAAAY